MCCRRVPRSNADTKKHPGSSESMDHDPEFVLPETHDSALDALAAAAHATHGRRLDAFVFVADAAGMVIHGIPRWPESPSRGHTIYASFYISSDLPVGADSANIVLLYGDLGSFIQIAFDATYAVVVAIGAQPEAIVTTRVSQPILEKNVWHSVAFSQQIGMFGAATASIFLNGSSIWRGSLPLHQPDTTMRGVIACSPVGGQNDIVIPADRFPGEIGTVAVFSHAIAHETLQAIHLEEDTLPIDADLYHFQLLPASLQPLFLVHPLAIDGTACRNVSSHDFVSSSVQINLFNARRLSRQPFSETLRSIGDINVLFPLLCQAALPLASTAKDRTATIHSPSSRACLVIRILSSVITQTKFYKNQFENLSGPELIAIILEQALPSLVTINLFIEILSLRQAIQLSSELLGAIDEHLTFNPQIWSRLDTNAQSTYFSHTKSLLDASNTLAQRFDIVFWLDIVEQYFCHNDHPQSDSPAWDFIGSLIKPNMAQDTFHRIIESLYCNTQQPEKLPFYRMCLDLTGSWQQSFVTRVIETSGCDLFYRIIDSSVESIQQFGLDWISDMLASDIAQHQKVQRALAETSPAIWIGILRKHTLKMCIYRGLFRMTIAKNLNRSGSTTTIRAQDDTNTAQPDQTASVEASVVLVDQVEDNPPAPNQQSVSSLPQTSRAWPFYAVSPKREANDENTQPRIRHPGFLRVVLELLCSCDSVDEAVLDHFCRDTSELMQHTPNLPLVRSSIKYSAIISLMRKLIIQHPSNSAEPAPNQRLCDSERGGSLLQPKFVDKLLDILLELSIQVTDKDFLRPGAFDEILSLFWLMLPSAYIRTISSDWIQMAIHAVSRRLTNGNNMNDTDYQNIVRFLNTVDEFLFNGQDISAALFLEYEGCIENWSSLVERNKALASQTIRRSSNTSSTHDVAMRPSIPFEESAELSMEYTLLLHRLIMNRNIRARRAFTFPWQSALHSTDDQPVFLAFRILQNALADYDPERWKIASQRLLDVLHSDDVVKNDIPRGILLNVLAHLYEAFKIQTHEELCLCIIESIRSWRKTIDALAPDVLKNAVYVLEFANHNSIEISKPPDNIDVPEQSSKPSGPPLSTEAADSSKPPDSDVGQEHIDVDMSSPIAVVSKLFSSDGWQNFSKKHLDPAMRAYESDWISSVAAITRRFVSAARSVISRESRDADAEQSMLTSTMQRMTATVNTRAEARTKRLIERIQSFETAHQQSLDIWNNQFLSLTFDRQVWSPLAAPRPKSSAGKEIRCMKLDSFENMHRMRRRLTRNFDFDDHLHASHKRDKLTTPVRLSIDGSRDYAKHIGLLAAHSSNSFGSSATSLNSLSERRRALAERIQKLQTEYRGKDELSHKQIDHSIAIKSEASTELPVDIENTTTGYDSGQERLVCSATCEMVVYMTTIKGRLDVTTCNLRFFPDSTHHIVLNTYQKPSNAVESTNQATPPTISALGLFKEISGSATTSPSRSFLTPDTNVNSGQKWSLSELQMIFLRRYKLNKSGLEFFFLDGRTNFFNFHGSDGRSGSSERIRILRKIVGLKPPNLRPPLTVLPEECMRRSGLTERWVRREISNFDYLMALNTYSGRTYNDLTQYPVFPWVLTDYKSTKIDLEDSSVYRDLSKPVGALNPTRLASFLERYNAFEDPDGQVKKFMYGSHYSSSASVLFYLMRLEPFTTLHISLQGGKFDHPDRLFYSFSSCWQSVYTSSSDVKELIPEFFYLPEFLRNENGFDLGCTQQGERLDDVILPPWATSAEEFIRINRAALESDIVSSHLHEWIDLIWGHKQTGDAAVQAHNVFYYLTYEGAVELDNITESFERRSIEDQINNFGQTPSQLFAKPHPQRLPAPSAQIARHLSYLTKIPSEADTCMFQTRMLSQPTADAAQVIRFAFLSRTGATGSTFGSVDSSASWMPSMSGMPPPAVRSSGDILVAVVDQLLRMSVFALKPSANNQESAFMLERDPTTVSHFGILGNLVGANTRPLAGTKSIPVHLSADLSASSRLIQFSQDGRYVFVAGSFDKSLRIFALDGAQIRNCDVVYGPRGVLNCLSLSEDGQFLAVGSTDTTVHVWPVKYTREKCTIDRDACRVYFGHDDAVTVVLVNRDNAVMISGSADGTIMINSLFGSICPISISVLPQSSGSGSGHRKPQVMKVVVAGLLYVPWDASFVAQSRIESYNDFQGDNQSTNRIIKTIVCRYSINGRLLANRECMGSLCSMELSAHGDVIFMADDYGMISVLSCMTLEPISRLETGSPSSCLCVCSLDVITSLSNTKQTSTLVSKDNVLSPKNLEKGSPASGSVDGQETGMENTESLEVEKNGGPNIDKKDDTDKHLLGLVLVGKKDGSILGVIQSGSA